MTGSVAGDIAARSRSARQPSCSRPRVADAVAFFQAQRDGPDVIPGSSAASRRTSTTGTSTSTRGRPTRTRTATRSSGDALRRIDGHVDLVGGWFDAGDFIKFTHTTAYSVGLHVRGAARARADAPPALPRRGALRPGLARAGVGRRAPGSIYLQVGIGSGNTDGTFNGDHDLWRLPEVDDALTGRENRYLRSRPAFRANDPGTPLPPNLAGRMAAAFALAAQVDAAGDPARARRRAGHRRDRSSVGEDAKVTDADVVTALPHAFYPESSWRDDLEWGAAELALAGQALDDPRADDWLRDARAAGRRRTSRTRPATTPFNLYDTSALAHADLVRAMRAAPAQSGLAIDETGWSTTSGRSWRIGRRAARRTTRSRRVPSTTTSTRPPHTFGLLATARLYDELTGDTTFDAFATRQRDWALGANPWGASLMIGVGTDFPQLPATCRREPVRQPGRHAADPARRHRQRAEQRRPVHRRPRRVLRGGQDLPGRWRRPLRRVQRPREPVTSTTSARGRRSSPPSTSRPSRCWRSRCSSDRSRDARRARGTICGIQREQRRTP